MSAHSTLTHQFQIILNEFDVVLWREVIEAIAFSPICQRVILDAGVHVHNMADDRFLERFGNVRMIREKCVRHFDKNLLGPRRHPIDVDTAHEAVAEPTHGAERFRRRYT